MRDLSHLNGWTNDTDFAAFAEIAKLTGDKVLMVEIGSWEGKSAIAWAEIFQDLGKDYHIYCIEPFGTPLEEAFLRNTGPYPFIEHHGYEWTVDYKFELKPDIIFLDAFKTFEDNYACLMYWYFIMGREGIMVVDDYEDEWIHVKHAVNAFVSETGVTLNRINDDHKVVYLT